MSPLPRHFKASCHSTSPDRLWNGHDTGTASETPRVRTGRLTGAHVEDATRRRSLLSWGGRPRRPGILEYVKPAQPIEQVYVAALVDEHIVRHDRSPTLIRRWNVVPRRLRHCGICDVDNLQSTTKPGYIDKTTDHSLVALMRTEPRRNFGSEIPPGGFLRRH